MAIFRTSNRPAPWAATNYFRHPWRLHLRFRSRLRLERSGPSLTTRKKEFSGLRSATNANCPALLRRKRGVSGLRRKDFWSFALAFSSGSR